MKQEAFGDGEERCYGSTRKWIADIPENLEVNRDHIHTDP